LGWRMVYYALPAMLGALAAGFGPSARSRGPVQMLRPAHPARAETLIAAAQRAETALVRQGHLSLAEDTKGARLIGRTPHSLVALFDPIGPASLPNLHTQARAEARLPALYKTSPRTAALARQSGWHVVALGSEARLCPLTFSTDGHTHATLRRKLRKAQNAGILVEQLAAKRTAELAAIARLWRSNRRERGFSIGQFDVAYLATQRVYVARTGTRIVGFISLHDGPREWTLDLMRHAPDAPDGTMHALILQAVADARTAMIPCLSLAAAGAPRALPKVLRKRADTAAAGLLRFKQSFAPHWQPLYLCAPTRFALCVATVEIIRAINWPAPIHPQDHHAQYGFAPTRRAWQRKGVTNP
jgi:phosphatidylglycerol lysyltransferase